MAGQTISDRLLAARHSIAGQGLAKSVCKATTEEMLGPKKKHLDYLVHCTNEPNVSIPQMANLLMERSQNTSWVVVYKALITTHHVMCYGNERFTQYLASSNVSFQLSNFVDKSGVQSAVGARTGYDMSPFIRRYARYLNEKALSYRGVAFDFCKVKRGKEEGSVRAMNTDNLLKTLPILQGQLDALLEFDCTANDLTNGVINMCFILLFRDLIRLFACYNDAIINLLEKYFEMNKKQCREALDFYKKFLIRMDRVGEFLKVAENIGIDKGDIPDLTKAPNSLLDALEQHLASLEGNTPTSASNQKSLKSGVSVLSTTSNAFGTIANSQIDDDTAVKQSALADEEAAMSQYRAQVGSPSSTNPFLSSPTKPAVSAVSNQQILDLFGAEPAVTAAAAAPTPQSVQQQSSALDDLLGLGNPFTDMFGSSTATPAVANGTATNNLFDQTQVQPSQQLQQSSVWANGFNVNNLSGSIFSGNEPSVFDPQQIAMQAQPVAAAAQAAQPQPQQPQPPMRPAAPPTGKFITGDLESSLASLAENLTIDKSGATQWQNSPKNQAKPVIPAAPSGGWQPNQITATAASAYRPMMQSQHQQQFVVPATMIPQQQPVSAKSDTAVYDPFGDL